MSCAEEGMADLKKTCNEIRALVQKMFNGVPPAGLPVPPPDEESPWLNDAMWQAVEVHVII